MTDPYTMKTFPLRQLLWFLELMIPPVVHSTSCCLDQSRIPSSTRSTYLSKREAFPFCVVHEVNTWDAVRQDINNRHCYKFAIQFIKLVIGSILEGEMTWRRRIIRDRFSLTTWSQNWQGVVWMDAWITMRGVSTRNFRKPEGEFLVSWCISCWYLLYNANFSGVYDEGSKTV